MGLATYFRRLRSSPDHRDPITVTGDRGPRGVASYASGHHRLVGSDGGHAGGRCVRRRGGLEAQPSRNGHLARTQWRSEQAATEKHAVNRAARQATVRVRTRIELKAVMVTYRDSPSASPRPVGAYQRRS